METKKRIVKNYFYITKEIHNQIKNEKFYEHFCYIISLLHIRKYIDSRYQKNDFIPLNYSTLKQILSIRKLNSIIKELIELQIIERSNDKYIKGVVSLKYRINPTRSNEKWLKKEYKDKLINRKMDSFKTKKIKDIEKLGLGYKTLNYWLPEIEIDSKKAKSYIRKLNPNSEEYEQRIFKIDNFHNNKPVVDITGNRFHSSLTNLNSDLRQFLSYNGNKLSQIDITNSQPIFLYLLLKQRGNVPEQELNKYKELIESGTFYEYLMKDTELTRNEFKVKVYSNLLYGKNYKQLSKMEKSFQEEFPIIFNEIRLMKENDYTQLAITLQKMESQFIIGTCVERITKNWNYNIFISTIHDSIVVPEYNKDEVAYIIMDEFNKLGLNPQLSIK